MVRRLLVGDLSGDGNPSKRPEVVAKISRALSGENNPMKRPEQRARMAGDSNPCRQPGYVHPMKRPEQRARMARRMSGDGNLTRQSGYVSSSKRADVRAKISDALSGERNPAWRGGVSQEPYALDWPKVAKSIRERDSYTCAVCGEWGNCVHHKDYDKRNNDPENLITLCKSCHGRTNEGRLFWQPYFEGQVYLALGVC